MRDMKIFFKRQAGYLLLEASLAMSVAAGLVTYYMQQQSNDVLEAMAKAHGEQMKQIAAATNLYIINNYQALVNNTPVPGVATARTPTPVELAGLNLLPAGFGANPQLFGGGYQIALDVGPVGCNLTFTCQVTGLLMTTAPVTRNGLVSAQVIGKALEAIGAMGGATGMGGAPINVVTGLNNSWARPLIAGITPAAGLMAVQIGFVDPVLDNQRYLWRDGTLAMTGNLNMGNKDVNNANTVNTQTLNANTGVNTANVQVTIASSVGDACTVGQVGRQADGALLECFSGTWRRVGGSGSGSEFDLNGANETQCGSYSPSRTCPVGSAMVAYRAWVTGSNITSCSTRCRWDH